MKIEIKQVTEQLTRALHLAKDLKVAVLLDDAKNISGWCVVRQEEDGSIHPVSNRYDDLAHFLSADLSQYSTYNFEDVDVKTDRMLREEYECVRHLQLREVLEMYFTDSLEMMRFLDNNSKVTQSMLRRAELERTNKANEGHE